jgi:hypothetical protein
VASGVLRASPAGESITGSRPRKRKDAIITPGYRTVDRGHANTD